MMKQRLHKCSGSGRSIPAPSLLHVWTLQCETMLSGEPSTSEFTIVHTVALLCKLYGRKGTIISPTKANSNMFLPWRAETFSRGTLSLQRAILGQALGAAS